MKKKLFLILIMLLLPLSVLAADDTGYIALDEVGSVEVGGMTFTNLQFKDYSDTSSMSFGITGNIYSNSAKEYVTKVSYYDSNFNLLVTSTVNQMAVKGNNIFNHFSNLDIIKGYGIHSISYFKLFVDDSEVAINESKKPSGNDAYSYKDYTLDKYDIKMVVNENNTFDITETITAHFNFLRHGIKREIPLTNEVVRLNGTTSKNRAQVTNVSVNNKYTTSRSNGNYVIKIGDAKEEITGDVTYVIKYRYNIGADPLDDYDELYFNLIGTQWDTAIGNITFEVVMPKEFDSSKLGFSKGSYGSTVNNGIKYSVSGNTISGRYDGILDAYEGLTIRMELPEGYFVGAGLETSLLDKIPFLAPIVFLLIAFIGWLKFGKNDLVVDTVEFYPPNGLNSLDVGFMYKGKAVNKDVTSLIVYLANKGYLKISEYEEKVLFTTKKAFKLTKLKEYDGNNYCERLFMNGLFRYRDEVTPSDLYNNFYITMNSILKNVNNKGNKEKIFDKSLSKLKVIIILLIIATYCLITIPPVVNYGDSGSLLFALLFPGIGFTVLFSMVFGKNSSIGSKIFGLVWGLGFGGMPWFMIVYPTLMQDKFYLIGYIGGLVCILFMTILLSRANRRTRYGNEILGKIKGFKNFLETAEKEKLEAMVMENPNYFYDILPYTYVLNVSDKWIKKFESINLQAPDWYDSPNRFDVMTFGHFMDSAISSANSSMSSSPSDSGGSSGSSGGGSSGGGSGGGGGSSW